MKYNDLYEAAHLAVKDVKELQKLKGSWNFRGMGLTSFEGCPRKCDNNFYFADNAFTSFEHFPDVVTGAAICANNSAVIPNLHGIGEVARGLAITNSNLHSLEGLNVKNSKISHLNVQNNQITSLVGCPDRVELYLVVAGNPITSWEGAPSFVGSYVAISGGGSLSDFCKHFKEIHGKIYINGDMPTNVLGVFNIIGLKSVEFKEDHMGPRDLAAIINEYLPMGKKGMMKCQLALIKAGYKDHAKL